MIKYKRGRLHVDGEDYEKLKHVADEYGISLQSIVTALLWEAVLREARAGSFKKKAK